MAERRDRGAGGRRAAPPQARSLVPAQVRAVIAPARRAAFALLQAMESGRGHSDELLRSPAINELSRVDRNLATALVMGVLRWQIALDTEIMPLLARPEQRPPRDVLLSLRLGLFQLRHMDRVPEHAAVNDSVELCRVAGQPQAAAMVNAVLRLLLRSRTAEATRGGAIFETTERFAQRLGHPAWLAERWVRAYGRAAALRICEAGQHEPGEAALFTAPWGAPYACDVPAKEFRDVSPEQAHSVWGPADAESAETGKAAAQDAAGRDVVGGMDDGSRLIAELAAAALPGARRVWDCCAAPGGKTAVLLGRLPEAEVLATDASPRRLELMRARLRGLAELNGQLRMEAATAEALPGDRGLFDLILCDVPCSGTGTLARNPEIRHRLRADDLTRQAERQRQILTAALARLAPGGRLVYATCSLEPEECEGVVNSAANGLGRVPASGLLETLWQSGVTGDEAAAQTMVRGEALRTLPGVHPCDGFYAVVLETKGGG